MKRILVLVSLVAAVLLVSGCFMQKPAVTLSPKTLTLKVGETYSLQYGTEGEAKDLDITKIRPVQSTNTDVCIINGSFQVTAIGKGTAQVGAAIATEEGKVLYSAYTTVTVQ